MLPDRPTNWRRNSVVRRSLSVIACIGGRGFGIRREDMKKLLLATRGKVFTLKSLDRLVDCTALEKFRTKAAPPVPPLVEKPEEGD